MADNLEEVATQDDTELFNSAIAETTAEPDAEPQKSETQRDEQGRFAAKPEAETKPETAPEKEADDDKGGAIPSWRLREEREARAEATKALETERAERARDRAEMDQLRRQFAATQKPPEQPDKPDPLIDPEGYERYIESKFEARLLDSERELSLRMAHRTYKDEFSQAYESAKQAMAKGDAVLATRMQRSRDPGETLMEWHKEQKVISEVGNDPNAFFEKRMEAYLSDPANVAKVMERAQAMAQQPRTGNQRPSVQLPPSLASMSRADGSKGGDDDSDLSDEALFRNSLR